MGIIPSINVNTGTRLIKVYHLDTSKDLNSPAMSHRQGTHAISINVISSSALNGSE